MTKRLPDFNTSHVWTDLREKMGATDIVELPALGIDQISFEEIRKLQTSSLDIENIKDHINPLDGTFDYKGQKVILYIKQQYRRLRELERPRWEYKYHLCYCDTLEQMELKGRFKSRYVVTQRVDGIFLVDIIAIETKTYYKENELCNLNVCKQCLRKLGSHYRTDRSFNYAIFDLNQFLVKYNTNHIKKPPHSPRTMPRQEYPKDWPVISKRMREQVNYICSECEISYIDRKEDLHVHHVDGVKWNNNSNNLKVLCVDCHSQYPGHQRLHMKKRLTNNYVRNPSVKS